MERYFDAVIEHEGRPLRVVWEYEEMLGLENPARAFRKKILPAASQASEGRAWCEKMFGYYGYIFLTYNFERILFITPGDPCILNSWDRRSFPDFIRYRLSAWKGKEIEYFDNLPPRHPFRFTCVGYSNNCHIYYLPATTEAALLRDFDYYPPTDDERALWKFLVGRGRIETASEERKAFFLIRYAKLINSRIPVTINKFSYLSL